ncbi:hypothetical protein AB4254_08730 [Vibrio breoganii]
MNANIIGKGMMQLVERSKNPITVQGFECVSKPIRVGSFDFANAPREQRVLRMIIKEPGGGIDIPAELLWLKPFVDVCVNAQMDVRSDHDLYAYITVRCGEVVGTYESEFHSDGFSMREVQRPEQNYLCVDRYPTEYAEQLFTIPTGFNPHRHNLHRMLSEQVRNESIVPLGAGEVYLFDPYCIHRRPLNVVGERCLVRLTFIEAPINDIANTLHPRIGTINNKDGLAFMKGLEAFS